MRTPTIIRKIFGKRSNATVTPDRTRELAKVLEESPTTPNDVVPNFLRDEMVSVDDALQHFWEHVRKPIYEKYFGTLAQAKEALLTAFASRDDKNTYSRKINKLFESEETLAFFGMVFPSSESLRELPRILFFVELVYEYMSRTAILNARGQFHDYQEQLEKSLHSDNLLGPGDCLTDDIIGIREDTYLKIKIIEKALEVGMDRFVKGWTTIKFDRSTGNVEFENRYGTTIMKKGEMFQEGASQVYVPKNPK